MDNIKYKYEIGANGEMLIGKGEITEIVSHIARQVQIIHTRLRKQNPPAAAFFRTGMIEIILHPASPVWEDTEQITEGIDFFNVSEKRRGG